MDNYNNVDIVLMKFILLLTITWLANGSIKFIINSLLYKNNGLKLIGYGGFPSTHTAIVSSLFFYTGMTEGIENIVMVPLLVIFWVVVNDALFLRMNIEQHAKNLNKLDKSSSHRERIGHKIHDIIGGSALGFLISYLFIIFLD